MPFAGSADTLTLTIDPAGDDTEATIAILGPGDTVLVPDAPPSPDDPDDRRFWSADLVWPTDGEWVAVWTVTGTGAGVRPRIVHVEAIPTPAGGAGWRPSCTDVARWVPDRTLVLNRTTGPNLGANPAQYTFDDTTTPTGEVVDGLITEGVNWVLTGCGPIAASPPNLVESAKSCAAVFAAAAVERGYPDQNSDKSIAEDLLKLAMSMRADLKLANEAATGTDPVDPGAALLPLYQFPPPPAWGDQNL